MKKKGLMALLLTALAVALATSCREQAAPEEKQNVGTSTSIEGDSTLYGLACYGCTDTVLVFLPGRGGDPVSYNILEATKNHQIIGHPQVGDWVAVIRNGKDSTKADMVINLDLLKGNWVSQVMPMLRERIETNEQDSVYMAEQDSLVAELMKPMEIGFQLKRHYMAQPVGRQYARRNSDDSPVIYPSIRNYIQWHVINGKLVLTANLDELATVSDGNKPQKVENDTAEFIFLLRDSLRLRFKNGERGYYRKTE